MAIVEYVTEEVRRQGHDVTSEDGLLRVAWMLKAWVYALAERVDDRLTVMDIINIGKCVEPIKNHAGIRDCGVQGKSY
jgi:hypothetical protein